MKPVSSEIDSTLASAAFLNSQFSILNSQFPATAARSFFPTSVLS